MQYRRLKAKGATFFFTVVTRRREKILCVKDNARLVKEAFEHIKIKHPFVMDAFVLLPDHIHCGGAGREIVFEGVGQSNCWVTAEFTPYLIRG